MKYELNEYQKAAVLDESKAVILKANVGSGKTTVLIEKILYLTKNKGISPNDIVVLTFTNKAANEIKERLIKQNVVNTEFLFSYIGTFHKVAYNMLLNFLPLENIGYQANPQIIDEDDKMDILDELIFTHNLKIKYSNRLNKNLENYIKNKVNRYDDDLPILYEKYKEYKKENNLFDFDDLLEFATILNKEYQFYPKWIVVDEFQDCDKEQVKFLKSLYGPSTNIFVVGDGNQIIYSWKNADKNIFENFILEFNAKEMTLPINYRSCSSIIECASEFITEAKNLKGNRSVPGSVKIIEHYNAFNEADYIAEEIKNIINTGSNYNDICILYRLQKQSELLEKILTKAKIPCEVSKKKRIADIPVLKWVIQLLRCCIDFNYVNCKKVVNSPFGYSINNEKLKDMIKKQEISEEFLKNIANFNEWSQNINKNNFTEEFYNYLQIDKRINPTSNDYEENKYIIYEFLKKLTSYMMNSSQSIVFILKVFLSDASLYGLQIIDNQTNMENNSVKLMTLHASKGLEFKNVFIIGVNDGILPLLSGNYEDIKEEHRLFFVGITRAKDNLQISYYTNPDEAKAFGGKGRFINMLPEAYLYELPNTFEIKHNLTAQKQVKHKKYGIGLIIEENNDIIRVQFEKYGIKEFSKIFNDLEEVINI